MGKPIRQVLIQPARDRAFATAHMCKATVAVAKHDVVSVVSSTKSLKNVQPADANGAASLNRGALLIADYAVPLNKTARGFLEWKLIQNVSTSGSVVGDHVFLSDTAGGWSLSPGTIPVPIGVVTVSHATAGAVLIDPKRFMQSGGGAGAPMLFRKRIRFSDLTAAAATQLITLVTLPIGSLLLSCWIQVDTVFNNGTANVQVEVGTAGDANGYYVPSGATEISAGTGTKASTSAPALLLNYGVNTASIAVKALFTSSAGDLNVSATTGDMYIYLLVVRSDHAYSL